MGEQTDIQKKVADTLLQQKLTIQVDIIPQNQVHRLLQQWRLLPVKRTLEFTPIYLGSMIKISKIIMDIGEDLYDREKALESNHRAVIQHGEDVARIIAIAIVNRQKDPPASLVRFILRNFSTKEIAATVIMVVYQMDVTDFMRSIISIRGMNLLKMKPTEMSQQDQGSSIASGPQ